eukprot:GEMP01014467.1.p1 GENE.GEMP01014467.1~~GEMP01014467.1.p1  ORF type:complete len:583 (+),score=76.19 GEMP01014467.1:276-2024(+)
MHWLSWFRQHEQDVISKFTLRFMRADLEEKYMEVHWLSQKSWLKAAILMVLCYTLFWICLYAVGDQSVISLVDFRMDHYRKAVAHTEESIKGSEDILPYNLIIVQNGERFSVHPYVFIAWHIIWAMLFMGVLLWDKRQQAKQKKWWLYWRGYLICSIMTLDVTVTALVNPTMTRFLLFIYTLLIRVTWMQTLWLVCVCSSAVVFSGKVGSHNFLTSVSVAELIVTNVVALAASRQMEVNERLSMYRLWLLKYYTKEARWTASETASLRAFEIFPIDEGEEQDMYLPQTKSRDMDTGSGKSSPSNARIRAQRKLTAGLSGGAYPSSPSHSASAADEGSVLSFRSALSNALGGPSRVSSDNVELSRWEHPEAGCFTKDGVAWNSIGKGNNDAWKVRSRTYLENRRKESHPLGPMFQMHDMRMFSHHSPISNCACRIQSLHNFLRANPNTYFLILNRIVPLRHQRYIMNICVHAKKRVDTGGPWDLLWNRFLSQGDTFRNERLKYVCDLPEGPVIVKSAISVLGGVRRPVLLGQGHLKQEFYAGPNYMEIDMDISTSRIARAISGTVFRVAANPKWLQHIPGHCC